MFRAATAEVFLHCVIKSNGFFGRYAELLIFLVGISYRNFLLPQSPVNETEKENLGYVNLILAEKPSEEEFVLLILEIFLAELTQNIFTWVL